MKVLLCGEGPHDIGLRDEWDWRQRQFVSLDGWLQPIVRHVLGGHEEFIIRKRVELQTLPGDPNKRRLPKGHGAKAYLAKRLAATADYDLVVYMVDADSNDVRDWKAIAAEIEAGFALIEAPVRAVACVPMSASESWLLADADAWLAVANYAGGLLPKRPEAVWGERDDPDGDHPHRVFARVCDAAGLPDGRASRAALAEAASVATMKSKCPKSAAPFLDAVAAIQA